MTQFSFIWEDVFYLDTLLYKPTHTGVPAGVNCCFLSKAKK